MNSGRWWDGFFIGLAVGLLAGLIGQCASKVDGSNVRSEAIKHNAARWVIVDEKTGETEFRWLDELGVEDDGETE